MRIYFDHEPRISLDEDEGRLVLALVRRDGPGPDESDNGFRFSKGPSLGRLLRLEGTEIHELPPTAQDHELAFYDLTGGWHPRESWTCFADTWAFDEGPRTFIVQVVYAMDYNTPPNLMLVSYPHNADGDKTEAEWREELVREDRVGEFASLFRLDLRPWIVQPSANQRSRTWYERLR